MVVDDDAEFRELLTQAIQGFGYDVTPCCDGADALDKLHRTKRPSMIILDLSMPVMDGTAFRQTQRFLVGYEDIPVALLSSDADLDTHAIVLNVVAALRKPIDFSVLRDVINKHA